MVFLYVCLVLFFVSNREWSYVRFRVKVRGEGYFFFNIRGRAVFGKDENWSRVVFWFGVILSKLGF